MIRETLKTLKENPRILLLFLAYAVVVTGIILLMMFFFFWDLETMEADISNNFMAIIARFMLMFVVVSVVSLSSVFVILPTFGHYIYEICDGKLEKGWFKRGLKRSWWKVFVISLIIGGASYVVFIPVGIAIVLLGRFLIVGIVLAILLTLLMGAAYYIGYTIVIAEENFSEAFRNIFRIGIRYLYKVAAALVVLYIPAYALSFFISYHLMGEGVRSATQFMNNYWIVNILIAVYGVMITAFLLTYSMKLYLFEKDILMKKTIKALEPGTGGEEVCE